MMCDLRVDVENVCRRMVWVGVIVFCIALAGCARLPIKDNSLGIAGVNRAEKVLDGQISLQGQGGNVINVSPMIAVGSSGVIVCIAMLGLGFVRARRVAGSIIRAIEELEPDLSKEVKVAILKRALKEQLADYLHSLVIKETKKKTVT